MSQELARPRVVLKEHRDKTIERLSDLFAKDSLQVDEFEDRLTRAYNANSPEELDVLTEGFPASTALTTAPAQTELVPASQVAASKTTLAILGAASLKGNWNVPRSLRVVAFMGGAELDFRNARFPSGPVDIHITAIMGGVEILVPPGVAVESNGMGIMGGFGHMERVPQDLDPAQTVLRIHGFAMMGGVHVETMLPGESRREARKRDRRERKAQRRLERGKD